MKVQLRQVAMQLFGTFVEVEAENICTRLDQLIPVLLKTLQQGVEADSESSDDDDDDDDDESEAENNENEAGDNGVGGSKRRPLDDKCLFNALSCIGKLFTKLPTVFQNEVFNSQINEFLSKLVFFGWMEYFSNFLSFFNNKQPTQEVDFFQFVFWFKIFLVFFFVVIFLNPFGYLYI